MGAALSPGPCLLCSIVNSPAPLLLPWLQCKTSAEFPCGNLPWGACKRKCLAAQCVCPMIYAPGELPPFDACTFL